MIRPPSPIDTQPYFRGTNEIDVLTDKVLELLKQKKEEEAIILLGNTQLTGRYWKIITFVSSKKIWVIGTRILQKIIDKDEKLREYLSFATIALMYNEHIIVETLHALIHAENRDKFAIYMANYSLDVGQGSNTIRYLKLIVNEEAKVRWIQNALTDDFLQAYRKEILVKILLYCIKTTSQNELITLKEREPNLLDHYEVELLNIIIATQDLEATKTLIIFLDWLNNNKIRQILTHLNYSKTDPA